jgi:imidazolonepropionase-like amidohydrolase
MPKPFVWLALLCFSFCARPLAAQDLAITNVRVIVGTGQVIEQGTIVIRNGRIASAAAGAAPSGLKTLDGKVLTAMAGFIDAHRHIIGGDAQR